MTQQDIIRMAREAGWSGIYWQWAEPTGKSDWSPFKYSLTVPVTIEQVERFAELVRADEREAIYAEWHSCVMSDLENGVKFLNEQAAAEWHKNYPAQSNLFPAWVEARGQA